VNINDGFGGVCNVGRYSADSACRQLGYTNAFSYQDTDG
jgi:hypothetical protein